MQRFFMTTNSNLTESKMIAEVRRWREIVAQERQTQSAQERARVLEDLLARTGL